MSELINKTMDRKDLDNCSASKIITELNNLILMLKTLDVKISSWYGRFDLNGRKESTEVINRGVNYCPLPFAADDVNFPWFVYWEIAWLLLNNDFKPGQSVLDLGGSSSLFSYFLAHKGLMVTTVDLQSSLVENANRTADIMNWHLTNYVMDMRNLALGEMFDHVTSVCVYEHIPMFDRVEINKGIKKVLKPGGHFSITFDYRNPSKNASINSPKDVETQFISPSGLLPRGNIPFFDSGINYLLHPFYSDSSNIIEYKERSIKNGLFDASEIKVIKRENDYTFGALFLEKAVNV